MSDGEVEFEVHESHAALWEQEHWRYAIIMGGRGNGRSGTASRYAVSQLLGDEYTRGAIMRAVNEDIRASCWSEIQDRLSEEGIEQGPITLGGRPSEVHIVDSNMFVQIGGNSLRAHGFKSSSKNLKARLKSLAGYNFIWAEEAEEIGEQEFTTLDDSLRTVKGRIRIVLTLNTPPKNHWIIQKFFDLVPNPEAPGFYIPKLKAAHEKDTIFITGTYRENIDNLDPHTIDRYQAYRDTKPAYYWQVIEGLSPDEVRGKIYTGWQLIDSIPPEARLVRFGVDFGWFPDPAAVAAVWYWNGSYIIEQVAYGTELSNEHLAQQIKEYKSWTPQTPVVCDSAEPKSIAELRKYGVNAQPCEKGNDSLSWGIQVVSQKKILVTRGSTKVWDSYENYAWAEDKDGNPKGVPIHTYSHAMDAVRYPITTLQNKTNDMPKRQGPPRQRSNMAV